MHDTIQNRVTSFVDFTDKQGFCQRRYKSQFTLCELMLASSSVFEILQEEFSVKKTEWIVYDCLFYNSYLINLKKQKFGLVRQN